MMPPTFKIPKEIALSFDLKSFAKYSKLDHTINELMGQMKTDQTLPAESNIQIVDEPDKTWKEIKENKFRNALRNIWFKIKYRVFKRKTFEVAKGAINLAMANYSLEFWNRTLQDPDKDEEAKKESFTDENLKAFKTSWDIKTKVAILKASEQCSNDKSNTMKQSLLHLTEKDIEGSVSQFRELKKFDKNYYNEIFVSWLDEEQIFFRQLNLKDEEIEEIGPLLNYPKFDEVIIRLKPDMIKKIYEKIDDDKKRECLDKRLSRKVSEGYYSEGPTWTIFKSLVGEIYFSDNNFEQKRAEIQEILKDINLQTLAALAEDENSSEIVSAILPFMNRNQLVVAVPLLGDSLLSTYLKEQRASYHTLFLKYATSSQKKYYIENDAMQIEQTLKSWNSDKEKLENKINECQESSELKKYDELEKMWREIVKEKNTTLFQASESVKKSMLRHTTPPLSTSIEEYGKNIQRARNEFEMMKTTIKNEIENKPDEIPDEFIDPITAEIMTEPYKYPGVEYTLDKTTWLKLKGMIWIEHPTTRANIRFRNLVPDNKLKKRIQEFKEEHSDIT